MLKHATINRTSRAQQTLQLQRQKDHQLATTIDNNTNVNQDVPVAVVQVAEGSSLLLSGSCYPSVDNHDELLVGTNANKNDDDGGDKTADDENNNTNSSNNDTLVDLNGQGESPLPPPPPPPQHPSPSPSLVLPSPIKSPLFDTLSRLESSPSPFVSNTNTLTRSPNNKSQLFNYSSQPTTTTTLPRQKQFGTESVIKVFAQTLSQDVEYITLHVTSQTKSQQIVRSLLKKFRLKHRDPNLFYLTLERWIRKDGLKFKSVMLLGDEACPLQLQQCCSNPPHNDIKFTLQMRAGALVKIFCSDVVPDARYKCVSLSSQTTVDETIELMLHCLNLVAPSATNNVTSTTSHASSNSSQHMQRLAGSPSPTSSSTSSNSSSSSGIESEPNCNNHHAASYSISSIHMGSQITEFTTTKSHHNHDQLDSDSRTSSVTSISSTSNMSNLSNSVIDQYCLVIECKDRNFKRMLEPDEYLVDVYQNLLHEAKSQPMIPSQYLDVVNGNLTITSETIRQQPDQWFFIKLMRRNDYNHQTIKFAHPRQNLPLPPIPLSLSQFNNANNLQNIVSTTQIEINCRPGSRLAASSNTNNNNVGGLCQQPFPDIANNPRAPPPPALIVLPPVRPRRRNLSNATSTFGKPLMANNRRRYDPAQLAEDLNKLDVKEAAETNSPVIDKETVCPKQDILSDGNTIS